MTTDYNADTSSVPYILDEFSYYFETHYDVTDSSFPDCSIDRPSGASGDGRMGIVNHMLHLEILGIQIPDELAADTTNSVDSINAQAAICEGLYGRAPNVVLVSCPRWSCENSAPVSLPFVLTSPLLAGLCQLGRCNGCPSRAQ
jgi:hypothetical protein